MVDLYEKPVRGTVCVVDGCKRKRMRKSNGGYCRMCRVHYKKKKASRNIWAEIKEEIR